MSTERIYLNVPFEEKNNAKKNGAHWDAEEKRWWVSKGENLNNVNKWLPRIHKPTCKPPHITSDMVPQNMWNTNLRSILPNHIWDKLRNDCYKSSANRCMVCGDKGHKWPVECNEQWQYIPDKDNQNSGTQKLLRLTALCPTCHSIKHLGKASINDKLEEALEKMAAVNGWTKQQCEDHAKQAFETWEERNKIDWRLDLTVLKDYGIDSLEIDMREEYKLPDIVGIKIQSTGYNHLFNRHASVIHVRKTLKEEVSEQFECDDWKLFGDGTPFWCINVESCVGDADYQLIDCTYDYYISNDDLNKLKERISQNEQQNLTTIIFVQNNDFENHVAVEEATHANHQTYMIAEFKNQDFEYIVDQDLNDQEIRIELGDFIDYLNADFINIVNTMHKTKFSGLEFLRCYCHKCEETIYRFSGIVTPDREVQDWSCNQWKYHQHATPQDLSSRILETIIPAIQDIPVIQNIKTTQINNSKDVICPLCNHNQTLGFFGDSKRINALHDNNARLEKLIYKPISLTLDYETMFNAGHRFECSQYSISPPYKPYLGRYKNHHH